MAGPCHVPAVHLKLSSHVPGLSSRQLAKLRAVRAAIVVQRAALLKQVPVAASAAPRVLGSGWLSVLVLPAVPKLTAVTSGRGPRGLAESAYQSTLVIRSGPPSPLAAVLRTLLNAAARVHGTWEPAGCCVPACSRCW